MLRRHFADAAELHGWPLPSNGCRSLSVQVARRDAWVLGSTTPVELEERCRRHAAARPTPVDVVRRDSGGGLVWLDAAESSWVDVFVPADDPLYCIDVSNSTLWLGRAIAAAFTSSGVPASAVEQPGSLAATRATRASGAPMSDLCMVSAGRGEVVAPDGRKLVGISQRRTRAGSRMSCVWYRHVKVEPYEAVMGAAAHDHLARFRGWADAELTSSASVAADVDRARTSVDQAIFDAITSVSDSASYPGDAPATSTSTEFRIGNR